MNLLIRKATRQDINEIVAIEQLLFNHSYTQDYIQTFFKQGSLLIALNFNKVIGVVGWFNQIDYAEIIMIGVKEEYQNNHVGNMLMKACISMLVELNVKTLFIEVRKTNNTAIKLYESLGFKENRIRENYYQYPIEDAIEMRLDI